LGKYETSRLHLRLRSLELPSSNIFTTFHVSSFNMAAPNQLFSNLTSSIKQREKFLIFSKEREQFLVSELQTAVTRATESQLRAALLDICDRTHNHEYALKLLSPPEVTPLGPVLNANKRPSPGAEDEEERSSKMAKMFTIAKPSITMSDLEKQEDGKFSEWPKNMSLPLPNAIKYPGGAYIMPEQSSNETIQSIEERETIVPIKVSTFKENNYKDDNEADDAGSSGLSGCGCGNSRNSFGDPCCQEAEMAIAKSVVSEFSTQWSKLICPHRIEEAESVLSSYSDGCECGECEDEDDPSLWCKSKRMAHARRVVYYSRCTFKLLTYSSGERKWRRGCEILLVFGKFWEDQDVRTTPELVFYLL
jgi:hypothetical protein